MVSRRGVNGKENKMKISKIILWILNIPLRLLFWPILWLNMRLRRRKIRRVGQTAIAKDEWHPLDKYLVAMGHVVKTFGYLPWEAKANICWSCVAMWICVGQTVYIFRNFLYGLL